MKKLWRGLATLIIILILGVFILPGNTEAIIYAPDPPVEGLSVIGGIVKSPMPIEVILPDGTTVIKTQKGLEGISLYIYECDNVSASC